MFETESLILAVGNFGKAAGDKFDEKLLTNSTIHYLTEDELTSIELNASVIFVIFDRAEIIDTNFTEFMTRLAKKKSILLVKSESKLQSIYSEQAIFNFSARDIFATEKINHIIVDLIKLSPQVEPNQQEKIEQVLFDLNCECYMNIGCGIGSSEDKRIKLAMHSMLSYLTSNSKTYQIRAILLNIHSNKILSTESRNYIENIIHFLIPSGFLVVQETLDKTLENKVNITAIMSVRRASQG